MTRFLLIAVVVGALSSVHPAAIGPAAREPDPAGIAGVYLCHGTLPNGSTYTGSVDIVRHRGTLQLLWTLDSGELYVGVGIVKDDVLAVTYFSGMPGLVLYEVVRDNAGVLLQGQWTAPHADGHVAGETLIRVGDTTGKLHFKIVPRPAQLGRRKSAA